MEVHSHPHTARKKWTHYFWEFLMLFFAVFCGFLAENKREHMVEHQREKQFMKTLLVDLKNDTTNFFRTIGLFQSNISRFDSLKASIKKPATGEEILNAYKAATMVQSFSSFNYSDRTIEQLRSAGNFRLINKSMVSDTLIEYDRYIRHTYLSLENILIQQSLKLMDLQNEIFDYDIYTFLLGKNWQTLQKITTDSLPYPLKLVSTDEKLLLQNYNALGQYRNMWQRMARHSLYAKNRAIGLMELIRKEYQLK